MRDALIPHEATTEFLAGTEVRDNPSIAAFVESLDPEQRKRFAEIAHHLVHHGFEDGLRRPPSSLDEQQQSAVLIRETTRYLQGAGDALDPPRLTGN